MLTIRQTLLSFLNLIEGKTEGGPFSRFKSWEYCHNAFVSAHNLHRQLDEQEVDNLALHLSFYLASWGMYRGSSFILQRDYKTHKDIVRRIFNNKYDALWDFNPAANECDETRIKTIAKLVAEAYKDVEEGYGDIPERNIIDEDGEKPVSITLITKVLMGTFAITPAFDRFFIDGIKLYNENNNGNMGLTSYYSNEKNIEKAATKLFNFAKLKAEELNVTDNVTSFPYPLMKKVDMYFWEIGYEYGFYVLLKEKKQKLEEKNQMDFQGKKASAPLRKLLNQIVLVLPEISIDGEHDIEIIDNVLSQLEHRF